jgi:hypothetical protein
MVPLKTFDLILGMPWLQSEQPSNDWKNREISFASPGSVIKVAQGSSGREELSHLIDFFPDAHSDEYAYSLMESIGDETNSPRGSVKVAEPAKITADYQAVHAMATKVQTAIRQPRSISRELKKTVDTTDL